MTELVCGSKKGGLQKMIPKPWKPRVTTLYLGVQTSITACIKFGIHNKIQQMHDIVDSQGRVNEVIV